MGHVGWLSWEPVNFASHTEPAITTQMLKGRQKQHINKWVWLCSNKTLFTKVDQPGSILWTV